MVLLTAAKASAFCSGVSVSPDTMSIIFPPNFGCMIDPKFSKHEPAHIQEPGRSF